MTNENGIKSLDIYNFCKQMQQRLIIKKNIQRFHVWSINWEKIEDILNFWKKNFFGRFIAWQQMYSPSQLFLGFLIYNNMRFFKAFQYHVYSLSSCENDLSTYHKKNRCTFNQFYYKTQNFFFKNQNKIPNETRGKLFFIEKKKTNNNKEMWVKLSADKHLMEYFQNFNGKTFDWNFLVLLLHISNELMKQKIKNYNFLKGIKI